MFRSDAAPGPWGRPRGPALGPLGKALHLEHCKLYHAIVLNWINVFVSLKNKQMSVPLALLGLAKMSVSRFYTLIGVTLRSRNARCGSWHNRDCDCVNVKCSAMSGAVKCQGPCQETVLTTEMDPWRNEGLKLSPCQTRTWNQMFQDAKIFHTKMNKW